MIIENPYSKEHYLYRYWALEPKVIDLDRTEDGDYYRKPTQYFFINFEPQNNILWGEQPKYKESKTISNTRNQIQRSMISSEYANRFIRQYIIKEKED